MTVKAQHGKTRAHLSKIIQSALVGSLATTQAVDYSDIPPESWQSKGKKPKPKVK